LIPVLAGTVAVAAATTRAMRQRATKVIPTADVSELAI
jgi:hypothetical protein